ncbi:MAG: T9SS type A sorting domain-containing protein, partial [Cyclobacteriaceae bacterium]|nr:T9SS type A sorting domain-containing protein [Cyclobacteriaceae bacterium]
IPFWWKQFLRDPEYVIQFQNRWTELRNGLYSNAAIMNYIDSTVQVLDQPQQRNFIKWPILGEYIWPNNYVGNTYENEINYLKNWISDRLSWLDTNIAGLEAITDLEDEFTTKDHITIYPNPNNGKIHIHFNHHVESDLNFSLHDNLGKIIYRKKLNSNEINDHFINTRQLSGGIYIVKISDQQKLIYTGKIVAIDD